MTDTPKAPKDGDAGSESEDVLELEELDFQAVEPTGKVDVSVSAPTLKAPASAPVKLVTGEVATERKSALVPSPSAMATPAPPPAPTAAVPSPGALTFEPVAKTPQPAPQDPPPGATSPKESLQEALARLKRERAASAGSASSSASAGSASSSASAVPAAPTLAPAAPPPAARASDGAAAATKKRATVAASSENDLTPLPGPPPAGLFTSVSPPAPWQAAVTSEVELGAAQAGKHTAAPPPRVPDAADLRVTGEMEVPPLAPASDPAYVAAAKPPPQDPFARPLLTPMARGLEGADKHLSTTTEAALADVMPETPMVTPDIARAQTPPWMQTAPPEEAPAMMDLLPQSAFSPPQAVHPATPPTPERPPEEVSGVSFETEAGPRPPTVTEPHASPVPPSPKARLKRLAPLLAGIATLLVLSVVVVVQHHDAPLVPPAAVVAPPPVVPKPIQEAHNQRVRAPKPVVPPVTESVTFESVDRLGYRALAAGVEALAANPKSDQGLLMWARWRLAAHFEDAAAKAVLNRALDALPPRGRIDVASPLLAAAQAGAALTSGRLPLAKRVLAALAKSPGAERWQTWYVQTAMQSRRALPPARLIAQLDRILRVSPNNVDVKLWRAEALLRRNFNEGVRVLVDLAKQKDPDVIARIAQVFAARPALMQALPSVLEPLDDGSRILGAAPAHQLDLLRWYTASRVLRGDYEAPRSIAEAMARGNGDAVAVAVWARLAQYQGDDPGAVLQQGIDAQNDKGARGWLLYEAVRLALERHDTDHAKFLADGMNSMPVADIGVFAPLAAARVQQGHNQQAQAKRHLADAAAIDSDNRYVQIARALDDSSPEVPIRWAGAPPVPSEILWQRAHATAVSGQGSLAARMAEELFWRDPSLLDPVVVLGAWSGWLDQAGEALHAESLLEQIAPALPDDDRPVIQLIKQARRGKRYDAAIQWYEVLLKRRPGDPELTVSLARSYIDAQKPEVAARVLSDAEHTNPNVRTPAFMTTMASALSKSDPTRARNLLAVALRVQPSADSYVLLADMENAAGHPEEELRALQAALPLAPDDGPLHLRVATLLRDKRMNNQAMALLQPMTNHAEAMEMLGDLLRESGDLPDALTAYSHADAAYQRADTARSEQAGLLVKMGVMQLDELHNAAAAIKTLQKAASVSPGHAETFYQLSRAFNRSGMAKVSKKLLAKYLHLAPDGPHAEEARAELGTGKRGASTRASE